MLKDERLMLVSRKEEMFKQAESKFLKGTKEERISELKDKMVALRRENHMKCSDHGTNEGQFKQINEDFNQKFEDFQKNQNEMEKIRIES